MDLPKTAIITGASRGIGKTVSMGLAADGYRIALVARSKDKLEAVAGKIRNDIIADRRLDPIVFPADVAHDKQVENLVTEVAEKCKRIDILFNNAGRGTPGTLELDVKEFDNLLSVNLKGPFNFLKYVVPVMKRQKSGHIINLASRNGKVSVAGLGGYAASKYGLVGLAEALYRELSSEGIKVTTLCPGWVNTDMAVEAGNPHHPSDIIQPEDILATIRWLLGLSASVSIMEVLMECSVDVESRKTKHKTIPERR